jgi:hypothetical protein
MKEREKHMAKPPLDSFQKRAALPRELQVVCSRCYHSIFSGPHVEETQKMLKEETIRICCSWVINAWGRNCSALHICFGVRTFGWIGVILQAPRAAKVAFAIQRFLRRPPRARAAGRQGVSNQLNLGSFRLSVRWRIVEH